MMKKILLTAVFSLATSLAVAQNAAVVNGKSISSEKLNRFIQGSGQPDTPEIRSKARDVLITKELLLQEADKRGISRNPAVQDEIEQAKLSVLVGAVFEDYLAKDGISDAELQPLYDSIKGQYGGKEYRTKHILVDDEKLAKTLFAQIKAGGNFEEIAKSNSKDKGSAVNGGSLDWVSPSSLVPEFAKAMTETTPGQLYPTPVKTQFGWHIIKVEEVKNTPVPTMQDLKPQLVQMLTQDQAWQKKKFTEMMNAFKAKAKIQ